MNVGQIIDNFRKQIGDEVQPYLYEDTEIIDFINEAIEESVRRTKFLRKTDFNDVNFLGRINLINGVNDYEFSSRIIKINAIFDINGREIQVVDYRDMPSNWRTVTGSQVEKIVVGQNNYGLSIYPKVTSGTLIMNVNYLPEDLDSLDDIPLIPEQWHRKIIDYVLYKAYTKNDSETQNLDKAEKHLEKFIKNFGVSNETINADTQLFNVVKTSFNKGVYNLLQIRNQFRNLIGDKQEPYMFNNDEITDYINEAYYEACRRAKFFRKTDFNDVNFIGRINLVQGQSVYTINSKILKINHIYRSDTTKIEVIDYRDMAGKWKTRESNRVQYIVIGEDNDSFTVYPTPNQNDYLVMNVDYLPDLLLEDNDIPLIPEQWHSKLVDYALFRGYQKNDSELLHVKKTEFNLSNKKGAEYFNQFQKNFGDDSDSMTADMQNYRKIHATYNNGDGLY